MADQTAPMNEREQNLMDALNALHEAALDAKRKAEAAHHAVSCSWPNEMGSAPSPAWLAQSMTMQATALKLQAHYLLTEARRALP